MDNRTKQFLKVGLLSVMFVSQLNTIASVIMADLMALFPDAGPTAVQMVMQFGMVAGMPVTLCVGFFATKFRIKPMIIIGLILMLVGGLMPFAFHSTLGQLYISALLIGAGEGFMAPLVSTLTLRHFENRPRERQIGFNATFGTGGATVFTLLAGVMALSGWLNVYYLYFAVIPALILVIVFMPLGEKPVQAASTEKKEKAVPHPAAFVMAGILIVMYMAYVTFPINVGMLVVEQGIGNAASTGIAVSIVTVVGAVFGLVFPYIVKVFKSFIGTFTCVFGVIGLAVVMMSTNMGMIYVGAVALGLFFGSAVAGTVYIIGRACKPAQFATSLSVALGLMTIGIILSPIIVNGITPLWGGSGPVGAYTTSIVIMAIALVLQIIWGGYVKKHYPEKAPEVEGEVPAAELATAAAGEAPATVALGDASAEATDAVNTATTEATDAVNTATAEATDVVQEVASEEPKE